MPLRPRSHHRDRPWDKISEKRPSPLPPKSTLDNETLAERSCQLVANSLLLTKLDGRIRISRHLPTHKKPPAPATTAAPFWFRFKYRVSNRNCAATAACLRCRCFVVGRDDSGTEIRKNTCACWRSHIHCYESRRTTYTPSAINPTVPPP